MSERPVLGAWALLVMLLHVLVLLRLLDSMEQDNNNKPPKVVEVVLLKPESVIPKEKAAPSAPAPAPAKPVTPRTVTPKKPPPKPKLAVRKETTPKIVKLVPDKPSAQEDYHPPVLTSPFGSSAKSNVTPTARPSAKPIAKTGSGSAVSKGGNSGVVAISRVKPSYPARAASRHIEGWVKIEFTVTPTGTVTNPAVVSGSPPGIFDEAGLAAIRQWKFKPRLVNGVPTTQRAVQTLKFTLSK